MSPRALRFLPFYMAVFMSFVMSGAVTLFNLGPGGGFFGHWMMAWGFAGPLAIVAAYVATPLARRMARWTAVRLYGPEG